LPRVNGIKGDTQSCIFGRHFRRAYFKNQLPRALPR
jgi:hypothetical protein